MPGVSPLPVVEPPEADLGPSGAATGAEVGDVELVQPTTGTATTPSTTTIVQDRVPGIEVDLIRTTTGVILTTATVHPTKRRTVLRATTVHVIVTDAAKETAATETPRRLKPKANAHIYTCMDKYTVLFI